MARFWEVDLGSKLSVVLTRKAKVARAKGDSEGSNQNLSFLRFLLLRNGECCYSPATFKAFQVVASQASIKSVSIRSGL
ncbi:hypothetical protein KY290_007622 [Solanum tuberosum]|uniref:Uncharacterized protein n=1 Tax=Solanum tuberosum TaxID=4113 RepID=A0ABQ7W634_SOLTU|nr:hypothetical protein KY290_007622 [Solanum tuberosum]